MFQVEILDQEQQEDIIINYAIKISSSISLFFCTLIILSYIILKNLKTRPVLRYIIYLIIANFILSLSRLIGASNIIIHNARSCEIIPIFTYYGFYATFFWISIFSLRIYFTLSSRQGTNFAKYEKLDLLLGFFFPIILPLVIYSQDWFGSYQNAQCGISTNASGNIISNIVSIYIPEGATFIIVIILNILIIRSARSHFAPENVKSIYREVLWYPLPILAVLLTLILDNATNIMYFWLDLTTVIIRDSLGTMNCLIYGFNPTLRSELKIYIKNKFRSKYVNSIENQRLSIENHDFSSETLMSLDS